MERRQLGETGVEVSRIILGCGNFGGIGSAPEFFGQGESEEEAFGIMDAAWALGITMFDTADAYGGGRSETMIGNWMSSRGHRPQLTTKSFNPMDRGKDHGLSRSRLTRQIESSLDRLGVEQIEAWGVSNFDADQLRAVLEQGQPAVVQNSYSLLNRNDEEGVLGLCFE